MTPALRNARMSLSTRLSATAIAAARGTDRGQCSHLRGDHRGGEPLPEERSRCQQPHSGEAPREYPYHRSSLRLRMIEDMATRKLRPQLYLRYLPKRLR